MVRKPREICFTRSAASAIAAADPALKKDFQDAVTAIVDNPLIGIKLKGQLDGLRRLRVGRYRIVYHFAENTVKIVNIADRKDVYR